MKVLVADKLYEYVQFINKWTIQVKDGKKYRNINIREVDQLVGEYKLPYLDLTKPAPEEYKQMTEEEYLHYVPVGYDLSSNIPVEHWHAYLRDEL